MEEKKVPIGVKMISILYFISAVVIVLATIIFFYNISLISQPLEEASGLDVHSMLDGIFLFMMIQGVIFVGLAVFNFFIGRGLWKGRNWARTTAIIFSVLGIVGGLVRLAFGKNSSILNLPIFSVIIGGYLFFNKNVEQAFS